jgi:hypothetical protein
MDDRRELVERALGYPFATPPRSFALSGKDVVELSAVAVDRRSRSPVLAYGSNASPEVLSRKLGPVAEPLPVVKGVLEGFDVVYSAHVSAYGSVPATLRRSPGTEVPIAVAYPSEEQLRVISATEPNYRLTTLRPARCRLDTGETLGEVPAYLSRHGCLLVAGSEVALAAIGAHGRRFVAIDQRRALERVRDVLLPGETLERFVLACVEGQVRSPGALDRSEAP